MRKQPRPVLITFSILAGLQVLTAGASLGEVIGAKAAGFMVLLVAAVQAGMSVFIHGKVTPWSSVVAQKTPRGRIIAGPAVDAIPANSVVTLEGGRHVQAQ